MARAARTPKPIELWLSLMAIAAVLLLPGAHAVVGCEDEASCESTTVCAEGLGGDDHGHAPPRHHHDESTCDLCRHLLITQHGLIPVLDAAPVRMARVEIDSDHTIPQLSGDIASPGPRTSRGPPVA